MKTFVITINCDNAAYHGGELEDSLVANLQEIADKLLLGYPQGVVQDYNGNTVGKYFFKIE
jgi:hypothetical protein